MTARLMLAAALLTSAGCTDSYYCATNAVTGVCALGRRDCEELRSQAQVEGAMLGACQETKRAVCFVLDTDTRRWSGCLPSLRACEQTAAALAEQHGARISTACEVREGG